VADPLELADLTSRAQYALRWLADNSDCAVSPEKSATGYDVPSQKTYAFQLAMDWHDTEHGYKGYNTYRGGDSAAAANTLVALKRRGLAANDGGGAWVQAQWWITPDGMQLLNEREARDE
jgi:hypothetical protein